MGSDSHRKHNRSPSGDESTDTSKRHKHCHRRHHRRHRSKHDDAKTDKVVLDVDYDDMEEGEIVEEDEGNHLVVEAEEKVVASLSVVESGEFKAADGPINDFDDSYMSVDIGTSKKSIRYLKSRGCDKSSESKDGGHHSHNDEFPVPERIANGEHDGSSSKGESRSHSTHKSPGKESRKEEEQRRSTSKNPVLDLMEVDNDKVHSDRRNSHSQKFGKVRHEAVNCSSSRARNHVETASDTTRSESPEQRRERSQSMLHDRHLKALHLHERDGRLYANGKVDYQDKKGVDRERSKERSERDLDRDWEKERLSFRSRDYEREKDSIRDRERPRETKSDIDRDRNCDGSRCRDLDRERDRRREKDRGTSRDLDFDRERRRDDSVTMYRHKATEWDRARDRSQKLEMDMRRDRCCDRDRHTDKAIYAEDYRSRKYYKYDCEDGYRNRDRRRSYEEAEYVKDRRTMRDPDKDGPAKDPEKVEAGNADSQKKKEDGDRDDDQNNYQETLELEPVEQEEEDIERIKEESRRRREAILLKYKAKQSQQQQQQQAVVPMAPKACDEQLMEQPSQYLTSVNSFREKSNGIKDNGKSSLVKDSIGVHRSDVVLGTGFPKSEKSDNMFCNAVFGEPPAGVREAGGGDCFHDNWDDPEGYYSFRFGEMLDSRYDIKSAHGKGVFSTVVRAKDLKAGPGDPEEVAVKIIRNNETMLKAGTEELAILKKLVGADPEDRCHCVRYLSHFKYRNHLCIVFESLHMNLREVLKKFGRNIGLKLTAVRIYAKQLFIALKHLRNCGVLHCDIKPDNMLVNDSKNVLKLCDFGSAMFAGKNEITPYLVSRFYRAPEIILGLSYDHPVDIWSVGCCLYELYTGKVLFLGPSNNDMLRLHMELKGPFPKKMLRKGAFIEQHFDHNLNFLAVEEDPVTKKAIRRLLVNIKPKDIGNIIKGSEGEDPKMFANFKDLLDKIIVLDPNKRLTVSQALNHPFITGK